MTPKRFYITRILICVVVITSILLFIILLYPVWLPWIGEYLVISDPLQKTDAIVILAGDENERLSAGAQLFQQGYASWFILTDMRLDIPNSQGFYSNNVKRKAVEQGVPEERILLVPGQVSTTDEEVNYLKHFITSIGFDSLIVVTSPFHTRRARLILEDAFIDDITLIIYPAQSKKYKAEAWWENPMDRKETILEYSKIMAHLIGCREYSDCKPFQWEWLKSWLKDIPTK